LKNLNELEYLLTQIGGDFSDERGLNNEIKKERGLMNSQSVEKIQQLIQQEL
jgi:hypothetical protein